MGSPREALTRVGITQGAKSMDVGSVGVVEAVVFFVLAGGVLALIMWMARKEP